MTAMEKHEHEHHINNLVFVLNQFRNGSTAKRYGHFMSSDDLLQYTTSRSIIEKLLVKECDNADDAELITGMETFIEEFRGTVNANA